MALIPAMMCHKNKSEKTRKSQVYQQSSDGAGVLSKPRNSKDRTGVLTKFCAGAKCQLAESVRSK